MPADVDVSNRPRRTYSPLDDKHNILYSRARHNFNYRHVQKPWFNVNPFLDKDVTKGEDIDKYKPENDAGIIPLQSLVIVENYFQDKPLLTKEFSTREFWDFLFSDDWSDGYSVRVFVGQLQHLLLSCLISMCQSGDVVQHSTIAYAKNLRQKYSVNKFTTKETEYAGLDETLLLEFIYYGLTLTTNSTNWIESVSSIGYPERSTTHSSSVRPSTDLESSENAVTVVLVPRPPTSSPGSQNRTLKRGVRAIEMNSKQSEDSLTKVESKFDQYSFNKMLPIPRGPNYRQTCSNFSNSSDEFKYLPAKIDLNKFMCTEKVPCLGWFDLADDSSDEDTADESEDEMSHHNEDVDLDDDFEENMYLGDTALESRLQINPENTLMKLKRQKKLLQSKRETTKNTLKAQPARNTIMREFSELDVKKYVKDKEMKVKIANITDENAMTYEGYVKMLDPEVHASKIKLRKRLSIMGRESATLRVAKRRPGFQRLVGNVLGTHVEESGKESIWKISEPLKKTLLTGQLSKAKKKKKIVRPMETNLNNPLIYLTTVSGFTFMHPASKYQWKLLKAKEKEKQSSDTIPTTTVKRRQSLIPTCPTALAHELNKLRYSKTSHAENESCKFPKAKPVVTGEESPDVSDTDDECDDEESNAFNTHKLNIRYSIERIKRLKKEDGSRCNKGSKNEYKTDIYKILKKYFRMQSVLKAFSKPQRKRRGSVFTKRTATQPTFVCQQEVVDKTKDRLTVGKLKAFPFLEKSKNKTPREILVKPSPFDNYPMELFRENMQRALKEFVVRREIVISDYNGRTSASITFTKKEVFTKSKYNKHT